jgi:hypothetical protein
VHYLEEQHLVVLSLVTTLANAKFSNGEGRVTNFTIYSSFPLMTKVAITLQALS